MCAPLPTRSLRRGDSWRAVFAMHAASFLLVGLHLPRPALYLSVVLFGLAAWSIPGIMGAAVGDYLSPQQAVRSLGVLTVFFGAGQAVGPAVAGDERRDDAAHRHAAHG